MPLISPGTKTGSAAVRTCIWTVLSVLLCAGPAFSPLGAQSFWRKSDRNTFVRNIQFNFNIPSARAVGLGSAFVAIADDATAGMANPAGLTILTKPEISMHYKLSRFSHTENAGNEENHDLRKRFTDQVLSQSYLSLVYPYHKLSFSLFRQELINFESSFEAEGFGSIFESPTIDPADFEPGNQTKSDIEVKNWGAACAFQPTSYLSLGVSGIVSNLEFRFYEYLYQRNQTGRPVKIFGVNSNSSDTRYSVNLGVKCEPTDFLSLGAVYRSGPRFRIANTIEDIDYGSSGTNISHSDQDLVFKVPDVYSFGAAARLSDNLKLCFDIVRVEYSDLLQGLDRNLIDDDRAVYQEEFPYVTFVDGDNVQDLVLKDRSEFHLGGEYDFFVRDLQIPIRLGIYTDPAHEVYTTVQNEALQRLFPRGKEVLHGTLGFGFVIQNKIQLDMAVNLSSNISEFLMSAVFRF